jgi:hypothetical protein
MKALIERVDRTSFWLALFVITFLSVWKIYSVPGFHFDEAWAANYAHKIAFTPGFWPLESQSAYTTPWTHYIGAIVFKLFGASLSVFRVGQIGMCVLGLLLLGLAVGKRFGPRVGAIFLWLVAFAPVLLLNHRFAIEMHGFQVLCYGLCAWGLVSGASIFLWLGLFFGLTSHILFLGPALAFFGVLVLRGYRFGLNEKRSLTILCAALIPFFLYTATHLEKPWKGIALLLLDAIVLTWAWKNVQLPVRWREWIIRALPWLALPMLASVAFFSLGLWTPLTQFGQIINIPALILAMCCNAFILCFFYFRFTRNTRDLSDDLFLLQTLVLGLIMHKFAPRYFETSFLLAAIIAARYFAQSFPPRILFAFFCIYISTQSWHLWTNYFHNTAQERETKFLLWRDSSRDFLSKQNLVQYFQEKGCSLSDISSGDARVLEALRFLAISDWRLAEGQRCHWGKIRVERAEFSLPSKPLDDRAEFYFWPGP